MLPGYTLKNTYVFEMLIGSGGMGEVWSAKRTALGDRVAIKVLKLNSFQDKETIREQLKKEAKITSILNHPNICKVFDFVEQDDTCFLVMELLEGVDLQALLSNSKLMNDIDRESLALYVIKQVLRALDSAHNINHPTIARVLHRDIKPSNIFLTKHGEVKLLDLGVAKIETDLDNTKTSNSFYSLHYTSPDLWENGVYNVGRYSAQNDIYSLGLVFYELISGKKAFSGEGKELYVQLEKGIIPSLDNLNLSPETKKLLGKWTNTNPSLRYFDVETLLRDIEALPSEYQDTGLFLSKLLSEFLKPRNYSYTDTVITEKLKKKNYKKSVFIISTVFFLCVGSYIIIRPIIIKTKMEKNDLISKQEIKKSEVINNYSFTDVFLDEKGAGISFSDGDIKIQLDDSIEKLKHLKTFSCGKEAMNFVSCQIISNVTYGLKHSYMLSLTYEKQKLHTLSLAIYGEDYISKFEKVKKFKKFKSKSSPEMIFSNKDEVISISYPIKDNALLIIMKTVVPDLVPIEDVSSTSSKMNYHFNTFQEGKFTVLKPLEPQPRTIGRLQISGHNFHLGKISNEELIFHQKGYCVKTRQGKITEKQIYYPDTVSMCATFLGDKTEPVVYYSANETVYEYNVTCKTNKSCNQIEESLQELSKDKSWLKSDCTSQIDRPCEEYSKDYEKIQYLKVEDHFGDFILSHWYNVQ